MTAVVGETPHVPLPANLPKKRKTLMLYFPKLSKNVKRNFFKTALLASVVGGAIGGANSIVNAQQMRNPQIPVNAQNNSAVGGQFSMPALAVPVPNSATTSRNDTQLKVYDVPIDMVGAVGAQLQIQYHAQPQVCVTTEPSTGKLMVMAPALVQQQIDAAVTDFLRSNNNSPAAARMGTGVNKQQTYQLHNLSWRELEDAIQRLAGTRLTVSTDRNGEIVNLQIANSIGNSDVLQIDRRQNAVTLIGAGASLVGWQHVVGALDQGQADVHTSTHIVPLGPAEPRRVRQAVQLVNATYQQEGAEATAEVDLNDNSQAMAIGTMEDLNSQSGLFGNVQIEFLDEINLVIIRGTKRDVQRVLDVIQKIKEQAEQTQPEVRVHNLQNANAQAVADLVTSLYEEIYAPRQGPVSITALGQPNALLLIGRAEVVTAVIELISKIDQPLDPANQLRVIRLVNASAVDVETRIREFFVEDPGRADDVREGLGTRVKVLADYRTNSLIIQAAPREMVEVQKLINQLDVEGTTAESTVQIFPLKNTLSADLQAVIQEVITGQATAAGAGANTATPPSGKLTIVGRDGTPFESGILAGVIVTSDDSVNSLVVRAPANSMPLIAELIHQLDQLPSAEARIKVFPITNGDATQLSVTLQQLFGLQVTAGQSTTGGLFGLGNLNQAALTTGGEGSLVTLRITPDVRTNSIVVSGSESDLSVIEALLYRLDEEGVISRRNEVIWLRNATANNVATALNTYLQSQRQVNQLLVTTNQAINVFEQVDREVFVVAEPQTNSLIVSATPRYFESIVAMIDRLDRRPPLVAIQVLIAEIRLDDQFEFGTELGMQDALLFDRGVATGGTLASPVLSTTGTAFTRTVTTGQPANVAGRALGSFGMGTASSSLNYGGLVLSAASESVGILMRALQDAQRVQILNRPTVTTMDNQQATTHVGSLVPRVSGVQGATGLSGTQTIVADADVGLILNVLPRVNQDGLITMTVEIQNSSVGSSETGIPVGFGTNGEVIRSPIINITEAQTTVSAYSGQTVVFAGLISKSRGSSSRRIPWLADLPLIGAAFRFDTENEIRKELLVVLTPRLVQTDEEYEIIKEVESSRMSWCLADILEMHGDVGLSGGHGLWGPARGAIIYPDMQPTVVDDGTKRSTGSILEPIYPGTPNEDGIIIQPSSPLLMDVPSASLTPPPVKTVGYQQFPVNPQPQIPGRGY
ncbi:MAG: hypothetical protein KDB03_24245 [Planctomycetales bacterium]|nr:hypothetical protein [Planctomycetales bacterium]